MKHKADESRKQPDHKIWRILHAQAAAHNADRLDPFARERAEAVRLVALIKERYSREDLKAEYLGEDGKLAKFNVTQREGIPRDVHFVSELCACLHLAEHGPEECDRMLQAKRMIAILREAQEACGEQPEPARLHELTELQRATVLSLWRAGATSTTGEKALEEIQNLLGDLQQYPDDKHLSRVVLGGLMKNFGLVTTNGKSRKWTRYYLTRAGAYYGEYLDCP